MTHAAPSSPSFPSSHSRLVQKKQVGLARKRAGERGPRHLPTREGVEPAVEIGVGEAEASSGSRRPLPPHIAACLFETLLSARVGREGGRIVVAAGHCLFETAKLVLGRGRLACASDDVGLEGEVAVERRALVVERHARALRERELAAVDRRLPGEHAEECRLAGAVWTEQGKTITAANLAVVFAQAPAPPVVQPTPPAVLEATLTTAQAVPASLHPSPARIAIGRSLRLPLPLSPE